MKSEIKNIELEFQPVEVNLVLETQAEVNAFYALGNYQSAIKEKLDLVGCKLSDDVFELLQHFYWEIGQKLKVTRK